MLCQVNFRRLHLIGKRQIAAFVFLPAQKFRKLIAAKVIFLGREAVLGHKRVLVIARGMRDIANGRARPRSERPVDQSSGKRPEIRASREHIKIHKPFFKALSVGLCRLLGVALFIWLSPVDRAACPKLADEKRELGKRLFCVV